jgi:hypothetical protein
MKNFILYPFLSISLFIASKLLVSSVAHGQSTAINSNGTGMVIQNDNTNTPVPSSALIEMRSSNKGLLLPRMTTSQIQQVQNPTVGLAIYDTDAKCLKTYNGTAWECASGTSSTSVSSPMTTSLASKAIGTSTNYGRGIATDNSGNYYVAGYFEGQIKFTAQDGAITSQGGSDVFIAKFNSAGSLVWKAFITSATNSEQATGLKVDIQGNVYVTGVFSTQMTVYSANLSSTTVNGPSSGVFVIKFNSSGIFVWPAVFAATSINDIALDANGNPHITGQFYGTVAFGSISLTSTSYDAYVAKLNASNGNVTWAFLEGGTSTDTGNALSIDGFGNVFLTGTYKGTASFGASPSLETLTARGSTGYSDIFVAKYTNVGNLVWVRTVGGIYDDEGSGIAVNSTGTEIYLVGLFRDVVLFGTGLGTNAQTSAGSTDIVIAKYDGVGNILFSTKAGGGYNDVPNAIVLTSTNNFYLTGKIGNSNCTFSSNNNPTPIQPFSLNNTCGANACFLAKYNSSGVLQFAISTTNSGNTEGFDIAHNAGKTWITGDFNNQVNFGFQQLVASYSPEFFIWQFSEN